MTKPVPGARAGGAPRNRVMRLRAIAATLFGLAVLPALAEPIAISTQNLAYFEPSQQSRTMFGQLAYRGGLELHSDDRRFGGLSGIAVLPNSDRLLMVSDTGYWLSLDVIEIDEILVGAANAQIERIRMGDDQTPVRSGRADAEGIDLRRTTEGVDLYASFERVRRVGRFSWFDTDTLSAIRSTAELDVPDELRHQQFNRGLEAIALPPVPGDDRFVILAEQPGRQPGEIPGWFWNQGSYQAFTVPKSARYAITDAAFLPDGRLMVLERRFNLLDGVGARIRAFDLTKLMAKADRQGEVLFEATLRQQIDNMEGLAVRQTVEGRTFLYLVSDDNHAVLQRTLLLKFELI